MSPVGLIAEEAIHQIPSHYDLVHIDKYCIMPDHIHLLLRIDEDLHGWMISAPTPSKVIGSMKRWISRQVGQPIWQKSFFEHGIRNQQDYLEVWEYIDNNPKKYLLKKQGEL